MAMMMMMVVMAANLATVPLPFIIVAMIVPSLGIVTPVLMVQVALARPNLTGSLRAMCSSLPHHGVAVQRGVTIRTVIVPVLHQGLQAELGGQDLLQVDVSGQLCIRPASLYLPPP